jgi:hypothetical protein
MSERNKNGPPITQQEIQRRFSALRQAMERDRLDALLVCGNQYAGHEGAVRHVSGFEIVHRYVYVLDWRQEEAMGARPGLARRARSLAA